nr:immunoglobulin light chain junction region [Macaca mulatta]MOV63932.1 immunoglobulin light chain junction region [Macaca mulatta]MOV65589.1 immunoglobulin light chain junction region [Macaca mulatta]
CQNYGGSPHSF